MRTALGVGLCVIFLNLRVLHPNGGEPTGTGAAQSDERSDFTGRSLPSWMPIRTEDLDR